MIKMGSFRSYVGLEEYEMKVPHPQNGTLLQPRFLSGELVVAEAHSVLKYTSLSKKKGFSGSLFVTNARLVFVSSDHVSTEDSVPLLSISTLCHYDGSSGKKTKRRVHLGPNSSGSQNGSNDASMFCSGSTRVHELLVICSSFRTLRVSFKFSRLDHGQKICNALIHWAFPQQPEKLFYLDYCRGLEWEGTKSNPLPLYNVASDWLRELKVTRSTGYRLTDANEAFQICQSLPESFVVPESLTEVRLESLARKLKGHRPPFWVWGDFRNSAILRMGKLHNESDCSAEYAFYELLRKAHPQKKKPRIYDLDNFHVKDIRQAMSRLVELCCPETFVQYEETDSRFYSLLENTKWLTWLSKVLEKCSEIADSIIANSDIVILQENESRDISCLISSVTQILLDARFRTITGFFSLIQKEWVAAGHSFHTTYMHASPVFLLFLDTVFQLITQNPFEFEFNEQLLNDTWDSCFDSTIGTFLFDSPAQRKSLESRKDLNVWHRILTKDESPTSSSTEFASIQPGLPISISRTLLNPMYKLRALLYPPSVQGFNAHNTPPALACSSSMCNMQLWNSLYLSRTIETAIMLGTGTSSNNRLASPTPFTRNSSMSISGTPTQAPTPSSRDSLDSPAAGGPHSPNQNSVFLFSTNNNEAVNGTSQLGGREPNVELKLVDVLLATLSSSTRMYRSSTGFPRRSPSPANNPNPASPSQQQKYKIPGSGSPGRISHSGIGHSAGGTRNPSPGTSPNHRTYPPIVSPKPTKAVPSSPFKRENKFVDIQE